MTSANRLELTNVIKFDRMRKCEPGPEPGEHSGIYQMLNLLFPNVETSQGRRLALLYGTIALSHMALSAALMTVLELYPDLDPQQGEESPLFVRMIVALAMLLLAGVFAVLVKRLWQKQSLAAAGVGFVFSTIELPFHLRQGTFFGFAIALLAVLHGIRGAQAARRVAAEHPLKKLRERRRSARIAIASLR